MSMRRYVKDADPEIIKWLKQSGKLVANDKLDHSYPFCWRSDTPLLYKASMQLQFQLFYACQR